MEKTTVKRVLHIVGTMNVGGQETFIMNLYRNINRDNIQFDFVVHSNQEGVFEREIEKMGGRIYRITPISQNLVKHCRELKKIMKQNNYIAVHRHTSSSLVFIDLAIARICGIKKRIAHSHNTSTQNKLLHKILRPLLNIFSNLKLACGREAGDWLFGESSKYLVINNGIKIEDYQFNINNRNIIRNQLNVEDKTVIGHIGRFSKQKNHEFILEIFSQIIEKNKNFMLLLIGDGELKIVIEEKAKQLGIENNIMFLGIRRDIGKILSAIDILIFPSLYEGLPVSLIEAQANGIPIIMSDTITEEVVYNSNLKKMCLNKKQDWIDYLLNTTMFKRTETSGRLIQDYDINIIAQKIEKLYLYKRGNK